MASEVLIKGMVCERCIAVIRDGITNLGYELNKVSLGKLSFARDLRDDEFTQIEAFLRGSGFALVSNKQVRIVNRVKSLINDVFSGNLRSDSEPKISTLLSETLHLNYDSISELFSKIEGITLEKYIISKRLEKVKELLVYSDHNLTQIAYITGFSSINHLSRQFKELTGLTPSHFKAIRKTKNNL